MTPLGRWPRVIVELGMGARLAVSGGRSAWTRLVVTALATGMCVALLLVAASVRPAWESRTDRSASMEPATLQAYPGTRPSLEVHEVTVASGRYEVRGVYVAALAPNAPPPPGVDVLPGPGQLVMSPALGTLLKSSDGAGLRPRIDGEVIGAIGEQGLVDARDLLFYAGTVPSEGTVSESDLASRWGVSYAPEPLGMVTSTVLFAGVAVLLIPLLLLMMLASRLGSEQRNVRSAAIRLRGASAVQLRRLIAGEALIASLGGLAVGTGLFLLGRSAAPWISLQGRTFFPSDITPEPALAAAILVAAPFLSVTAALVAARSVIVEPLRIRRGGTRQPKMLWRLAVVAAAAVSIWFVTREGSADQGGAMLVVAIGLTLLTIPAIVPYVVNKLAAVCKGRGTVPIQLSLRRLQLDGGETGRIASAIAVVLAGIIALVPLLGFAAPDEPTQAEAPRPITYMRLVDVPAAALTSAPQQVVNAVPSADPVLATAAFGFTGPDGVSILTVADCATILAATRSENCTDGQVFSLTPDSAQLAGQPLQLELGDTASRGHLLWDVPDSIVATQLDPSVNEIPPGLLVTPGALSGAATVLRENLGSVKLLVGATTTEPLTRSDRDATANALADYRWHLADNGSYPDHGAKTSKAQQLIFTIQTGLLVGGGFLTLLAVLGLILTIAEHISSRRRAITFAIAAGVPRATIAYSLIASVLLPCAVAFTFAAIVGFTIPQTIGAYLGQSMPGAVNPLIVGPLIALAAVLAVTSAALPSIAALARPDALRTE